MKFSRPYDMTKFRKEQNSKLKIKDGFYDPITWIDTGNLALNKMISGDFYGGIPIGSITTIAGASGCLPATAIVKIRQIKMIIEKNVNVGELRQLFLSNDYDIEIDSPDGYQKLTSWWDKGVLPIIKIFLTNGCQTRCASNHLLQTVDGIWLLASEVAVGTELLTTSGISSVSSVEDDGFEECYDFQVAHPNHRYWGDGISSHNSGKSLIASGNIVRNALGMGISVVVLDTENAVKKKWAEALGVPTEHEGLIRWAKSTINEVAKTISDFMDSYIDDVAKLSREEQPPVLFVIDSLGNLDTEVSMDQFKAGDLKGDKGIFAKQLKAMLKSTMGLFEGYQVGMVCTNHTYKSQSIYEPEDVIGGGVGGIYLSDIVVSMNKGKLRENSEGDKVTGVQGIRANVKCVKSRYAKPFEEVEIRIPYDKGMDKYSGLVDMFKQKGLLVKSGNKLAYTDQSGKDHAFFEKYMREPAHDPKVSAMFDLIINEYDDSREPVGINEVKEIEEND